MLFKKIVQFDEMLPPSFDKSLSSSMYGVKKPETLAAPLCTILQGNE